jgi:signal transduction histidine kinase
MAEHELQLLVVGAVSLLVSSGYRLLTRDHEPLLRTLRKVFYDLVSLAFITLSLIGLVLATNTLINMFPPVRIWMVPFGVGVVVYLVGSVAWKKVRDTERLKYEFITIATHKLRTPLTRIRWVIPELLAQAGTNASLREGVRRIDDSNNRLIELTNVLMEAAHPGGQYDYQQIPVDLKHLAWEALKRFATQISEKKLAVSVDATYPPKAMGDMRRLGMVVEVLVENAIMYTPPNGTIRIAIEKDRRGVRLSVTDSGIGVRSEDQGHIFSSFFRTKAAHTTDTEGVGLGLSLAKSMIERQHGRIGVTSRGEGRGSTFWFVLPAAAE